MWQSIEGRGERIDEIMRKSDQSIRTLEGLIGWELQVHGGHLCIVRLDAVQRPVILHYNQDAYCVKD